VDFKPCIAQHQTLYIMCCGRCKVTDHML